MDVNGGYSGSLGELMCWVALINCYLILGPIIMAEFELPLITHTSAFINHSKKVMLVFL